MDPNFMVHVVLKDDLVFLSALLRELQPQASNEMSMCRPAAGQQRQLSCYTLLCSKGFRRDT